MKELLMEALKKNGFGAPSANRLSTALCYDLSNAVDMQDLAKTLLAFAEISDNFKK